MITIEIGDLLNELTNPDNYWCDCPYWIPDSKGGLFLQGKRWVGRCTEGKIVTDRKETYSTKTGKPRFRTVYDTIECPMCKGTGRVPNKNMGKLKELKYLMENIPDEPEQV